VLHNGFNRLVNTCTAHYHKLATSPRHYHAIARPRGRALAQVRIKLHKGPKAPGFGRARPRPADKHSKARAIFSRPQPGARVAYH
jgi:hypothetical protein